MNSNQGGVLNRRKGALARLEAEVLLIEKRESDLQDKVAGLKKLVNANKNSKDLSPAHLKEAFNTERLYKMNRDDLQALKDQNIVRLNRMKKEIAILKTRI